MFKKMMLGFMAVAFLSATSISASASGSTGPSQMSNDSSPIIQKSNDSNHIILVRGERQGRRY